MGVKKNPEKLGSLGDLFEAQHRLSSAFEQVLEIPRDKLVKELTTEVGQALELQEADEAALRLTTMAEVLSELEGADVVDLLIRILGSSSIEARREAGEALEDLAYDRFKEVALGVERHIALAKSGDVALAELPYLLVSIPEPGVVKLLGQFLRHKDPDAVAAAIEAIAELGDVTARSLLKPLFADKRVVEIEDASGVSDRVTLGELAKEAEEILAKA